MDTREHPFDLTVESTPVRGILHRPPAGSRRGPSGVILLHGWSGCRLGPHRMFVKAARALSADGLTCLRFDFRGRGESGGEATATTIAGMTRDAEHAVAALRAEGLERITLLGICSGGKVAIGAATACPSVTRLVLWSGEAMGNLRGAATGRRKTRDALKQYARKAMRPATWGKVIRGHVHTDLVRKAVLDHETPSDAETVQEAEILSAFRRFRGDVLFVYGGNDPATREAADGYRRFCAENGIAHAFHAIAEANHSFYSLAWEHEVIEHTRAWLRDESDRPPGGREQA